MPIKLKGAIAGPVFFKYGRQNVFYLRDFLDPSTFLNQVSIPNIHELQEKEQIIVDCWEPVCSLGFKQF